MSFSLQHIRIKCDSDFPKIDEDGDRMKWSVYDESGCLFCIALDGHSELSSIFCRMFCWWKGC